MSLVPARGISWPTEIYDELSAIQSNKMAPHDQTKVVNEVKETIVKEVVTIPRNYCRGRMPQTSIFCPECGARREA